MSTSLARPARLVSVIGLVAVLLSIAAACSSGGDDAGGKPKGDKSSSSEEKDYGELAEAALVSADMEMLSEHEPEFDEPDHYDLGRPFMECEVEHGLFGGVRDTAYQNYQGDPVVTARGFSLDGSAVEKFAEMREARASKACDSFDYDGGGTGDKWEYERLEEIEAPKDLDAETWYGGCFKLTNIDSGDVSGECRVHYVLDDERIGEVSSVQAVDDNEVNTLFLTLLAVEAMTGDGRKD